jgi:hypothetical protein
VKCPNIRCGSDRAYVGLNVIECPNRICIHFSAKLDPKPNEKFWAEIDAKLAATMKS